MADPFRVIVAAESSNGEKLYVYGFARELLDGQDQVDPWSPADSGRWSSTVVWTEKPQRGGEWPGEFARGAIGPARPELPAERTSIEADASAERSYRGPRCRCSSIAAFFSPDCPVPGHYGQKPGTTVGGVTADG